MSVGAENIPFDNDSTGIGESQVRTMTYADLKQVMEVEVEAYTHPWTIGIFRDCLRVGYSCWVLTEVKTIIGYGIVMLAPGEAHILNLCIKSEYQGKGLGRNLLNYMAKKAAQSDIDMILL